MLSRYTFAPSKRTLTGDEMHELADAVLSSLGRGAVPPLPLAVVEMAAAAFSNVTAGDAVNCGLMMGDDAAGLRALCALFERGIPAGWPHLLHHCCSAVLHMTSCGDASVLAGMVASGLGQHVGGALLRCPKGSWTGDVRGVAQRALDALKPLLSTAAVRLATSL